MYINYLLLSLEGSSYKLAVPGKDHEGTMKDPTLKTFILTKSTFILILITLSLIWSLHIRNKKVPIIKARGGVDGFFGVFFEVYVI